MRIISKIVAVFFAAALFSVPTISLADAHEQQKAVLVTGASSGIGLSIAKKLASEGHFVYAGARKDKDLAMLDAMENMKAVRLDVTSEADINAAVELVKSEGRGLWGIVNNAGVIRIGKLLEVPEKDLDFTFGVNVYGPFRINKAFAPLILESKGRLTTIGSINGIVASPNAGTYSMSKFAVEAYTDALAAEMAGTGVHVSVIDPGAYKSKIRDKLANYMLAQAEAGEVTLTEQQRAGLQNISAANANLKEPDEVADAALHAIFSDSPKRRYLVAPDEQGAQMTIRTAMSKVVQLNKDQPYTYTRDELITILDEVMAAE